MGIKTIGSHGRKASSNLCPGVRGSGRALLIFLVVLTVSFVGCTTPTRLNLARLELRINNSVVFSQDVGAFGAFAWGVDEIGSQLPLTSLLAADISARFTADFEFGNVQAVQCAAILPLDPKRSGDFFPRPARGVQYPGGHRG